MKSYDNDDDFEDFYDDYCEDHCEDNCEECFEEGYAYGYESGSRNARRSSNNRTGGSTSGGCYVATAVYGSYNCPPVWTLRRFRDHYLQQYSFGRAFIRFYYAVSPTLVKKVGECSIFQISVKWVLDKFVAKLKSCGYSDKPYHDVR